MLLDEVPLALTFDDVLLVPRHSRVLPREVSVTTSLSPGIRLNIPMLSAAMDTVTTSQTAIAMAFNGGLGVVHKNLSVEAQAGEVRAVKKAVTGTITDPLRWLQMSHCALLGESCVATTCLVFQSLLMAERWAS